jgi:transcriptional regulator with XRE-family HTH domain
MQQSRSPLAVVLEKLGVSQGELARRSGLARQTITDAYHGRPVSTLTMVRIAKALHVPLSMLDPVAAQALDGLVVR